MEKAFYIYKLKCHVIQLKKFYEEGNQDIRKNQIKILQNKKN